MWEERFAQPGYLFGTEPVPFLRKHAALFQSGQTVLSIAEGEGRNAVHLAKQGLDVTGVEFAPSAVAKAHELARQNDVAPRFIEADLLAWDWPQDSYDIVLGLFFQFVGPEVRDVLFANMLRAARPGGLVVIHGYTPEQIALGTGGPPFVENMYTEASFSPVFDGCERVICERYEAEQRSSSAHVGMSALIDFVARKPGV